MISSQEESFVQTALAEVEKSEKRQQMKLLALRILAVLGALWFALSGEPNSFVGVTCWVIIILALGLAVSTARILSVLNANTKAVLHAIQDLHRSPTR